MYSKKKKKKKRISPNLSKKPGLKVIVAVDIEQKNQNEHIDIETENVSAPQTVSSSKMEDIKMNENDRESGFRLVEMSILSKVLSLLACPNCYIQAPLN